jgi:3-deoxy-manno-octulosonate cytidylyltransferase (CMP-KDO synthetase)
VIEERFKVDVSCSFKCQIFISERYIPNKEEIMPTKKILCVIPARLGSTRLPRKPLALIGDKPLVQHTYESACRAKEFCKIIVATDAEEVAEVIKKIGGEVVMTPVDVPTGSDRVALVAKDYPDMDVVVNLQGDEPFIKKEMLSSLVAPFFTEEEVMMTTLACPIHTEEKLQSTAVVKVLVDQKQNAIYFSRAAIPFHRTRIAEKAPVFQHQGVYAFSQAFLKIYTQLPSTPFEQIESLEQLRVLEHGFKIRVCVTEHELFEVNTEEELKQANEFWKEL